MSINNTGSILLRRGPTADRELFCPLDGEIIYDSTLKKVYVGDGETYGGIQVGGTNITSIDQLSDVDTSTTAPINGQALIWASNNWVPQSLSGAGVYVLPTSSTSVLGGVKVDGTTITISNGVISSTGGSGGGISGITVKASGVTQGVAGAVTTLNFSGTGVSTSVSGNTASMIISTGSYTLPTATTSVLGGVKIDGTTITISGSGVISASLSTYSGTLQAYKELVVSTTVSTSTANIDLSTANIFDITLSNNVTFTFINPPSTGSLFSVTVILRQDTAGNRLATFTNAKYSDGVLPVLSTGSNQIDVLSFFTVNGGSFWFGSFAMANVS